MKTQKKFRTKLPSHLYLRPDQTIGSREGKYICSQLKCSHCSLWNPLTRSYCSRCSERLPSTTQCEIAACPKAFQEVRVAETRADAESQACQGCHIPFPDIRKGQCCTRLVQLGTEQCTLFQYEVSNVNSPERPHLQELYIGTDLRQYRFFCLESGFYITQSRTKNAGDTEERIKKLFGQSPFADEDKMIRWTETVNQVQRCFQETIMGHLPQRAYIDIDNKTGEEYSVAEWDKLVASVLAVACKLLSEWSVIHLSSEEVQELLTLYSSHGRTKRSSHAIFDVWVSNFAEQKVFQKELAQGVEAAIGKELVDVVASSNRKFRMPLSWKFCTRPADECRPKLLDPKSPNRIHRLVQLPYGGPEHLRVVPPPPPPPLLKQKKIQNRAPVPNGNGSPANIGIPDEVTRAVQLAKHIIDPFGSAGLSLRLKISDSIYALDMSNTHAGGFECFHCGSWEPHSHGNSNPILCLSPNGNFTVRSRRKASVHRVLQIGPVSACESVIPASVHVIEVCHDKLFRPILQNNDGSTKSEAELKERLSQLIGDELECGGEKARGPDSAEAFIIQSHLTGGCAIPYQTYPNVVIQSICTTGKTTQAKKALEQIFRKELQLRGQLPRVLWICVRKTQTNSFVEELREWSKAAIQGLSQIDNLLPPDTPYCVDSYLNANSREKLLKVDFLFLQVESEHKLVSAMNDCIRWQGNLGRSVVVLDEICSILKQHSSSTNTELSAGLMCLEQIMKCANHKLLLDMDIDQRVWDYIQLSQPQQRTVLFKNTFKFQDAATSRRTASLFPSREKLQQHLMRDLNAGEKRVYFDNSVTELRQFLHGKAQPHAQEQRYGIIFCCGDRTFIQIPDAHLGDLTDSERESLLCGARDGAYGFSEADDWEDVKLLDTKYTTKDVSRWWSLPWIRLIAYTTTFTVGVDFNELTFEEIYAVFTGTAACVRDQMQAKSRCRRVKRLNLAICTRSFSAGTEACWETINNSGDEDTELHAVHEALNSNAADIFSDDWVNIQAGRKSPAKFKYAADLGWGHLPPWFKAIHRANRVEDARTQVLTRVEVMRYLVDVFGYEFISQDFLPDPVDAGETRTVAVEYGNIDELTEEQLQELLQRFEDGQKITRTERIAFRRHRFDTLFHRAPEEEREAIWNTYLAANPTASDQVCDYKPRDRTPLAAIVFQLQAEHSFKYELVDQPNPLHLTLVNRRAAVIKSLCALLGLKHSHDVGVGVLPRTVRRVAPDVRNLEITKLWKPRKSEQQFQVVAHIKLAFQRWAGVNFTRAKKVKRKREANCIGYVLTCKRPFFGQHLVEPDEGCLFELD